MRSFVVRRHALTCAATWRVSQHRFQHSHSPTPPPPPPSSPASSSAASRAPPAPPTSRPRGFRIPDESLSRDLGGFDHYAGSITAFVKSDEQKQREASLAGSSVGKGNTGALPCEETGSKAALQAEQASQDLYMTSVATTGKLPSPRDRPAAVGQLPERPFPTPTAPRRPPPALNLGGSSGKATTAKASAAGRGGNARAPPGVLASRTSGVSSSPASPASPVSSSSSATPVARKSSSLPRRAASSTPTSQLTPEAQAQRAEEAAHYYRALPQNELSKEEMWGRIVSASADKAEQHASALEPGEVDYLKMEEELQNFDLFHYRLGEMAYPDLQVRRDYYALWNLAMSLNKARWTMLEVHSQRAMKTTGAGMKLLFWKEAVGNIIDQRQMTSGQFTDSHPVLRPFASAVSHNPHMTKAFVRGFTDARLRVIQQPGSVKQLYDHFDKFYGYFYNSLLEVTGVKDEAAEHMMLHIGRATGLTTHCVMFWKKYARIGFTMLPADLCADSHVNLALLKNISLASRDRAVRKVLCDVMSLSKGEMLKAQALAKDVPPKAWPVVMECLYANYYLGFLQRRDFNVSAMFADYNIENAGFVWYRLKKRMEWERHQSIERLVSESAPLPLINCSPFVAESKYKMASGLGQKSSQ